MGASPGRLSELLHVEIAGRKVGGGLTGIGGQQFLQFDCGVARVARFF